MRLVKVKRKIYVSLNEDQKSETQIYVSLNEDQKREIRNFISLNEDQKSEIQNCILPDFQPVRVVKGNYSSGV